MHSRDGPEEANSQSPWPAVGEGRSQNCPTAAAGRNHTGYPMKKSIWIAAAAALMTATPAAANGYLGLEYGNTDAGGGDVDVWQGEGAFGWNSGSIGGQIGGAFGNIDGGSGSDADFYNLNGHLYYNGGGWRLGGVIAHTSFDTSPSSVDETVYGIEGMVDLGPSANIYGSYTVGEADFIVDVDTWNLDAGINFYATPNVRLGAMVGIGNIDGGGGGDADTNTYGLNAEFQPFSAPISLTLGWNHFEVDGGGSDADNFQIGARWNFGGGTLQERNNATPFSTPTALLSRIFGTY